VAGFAGCAAKKKRYKRASKATMRTYCVRGKTYKPTHVRVGTTMRGISSWYGPNFHGKLTSNGERYNMHARTAAHKTLPMNTMVKVTNLQNGKSTIVRINDRGPFVKGRIIDCSYKAGKEIGLDRMGIAKVKIKVLGFAGKIEKPAKRKVAQVRKAAPPKPSPVVTKTAPQPQSVEAKGAEVPTGKEEVVLTDYGLQVGAFNDLEGAKKHKAKYASLDPRYKPIIKKTHDEEGTTIYRIWLMGFTSEEEARDFRACQNMPGAFIVRN
jgi:rare lipoprotein A